LLGETRDDAAGEAFDKVAKILGLGYPGGPLIQKTAQAGNARAFDFPRPMWHGGQQPDDPDYYDFSFSGLKTSVLTRVRELERQGTLTEETPNVAASFQRTVIDVLVGKTLRAVNEKGCRKVVLGGGVAASQALRNGLSEALAGNGAVYYPSLRLATDNGAMIARTALFRYQRGEIAGLDFTARADLPFPGLVRP
jgi:N6-L-threonylcarbamoyladenine synthase